MNRKPTLAQAQLIRWIAQRGGVVMITNTPKGKCYTIADGTALNRQDVEGVIPFLIANKDGLFGDPQSFRVRTPGDQ